MSAAEDATDAPTLPAEADAFGADPILARPTRTLAGGLRPGYFYWVDPTSPYVLERLLLRQLIPVDPVEA